MYPALLHIHSFLRYLVLLLLVIVVVKSFVGWVGKLRFSNLDNKFSLWLLIVTHTQLLIGLFLYFVSPFVQFNGNTMKDFTTRYWTVEHGFMMILAIALITIGRITYKKLPNDAVKHQRLFLMNGVALIIIIIAIVSGGPGLLASSWMR